MFALYIVSHKYCTFSSDCIVCLFYRGLDLVQRLLATVTGHAQTESTRLALQRLLGSNLAAKYWVTGHLDHTDLITETEFFDPGPVSQ